MGFRFRRRIRLLPGITLNLGKRGASVSAGVRGAHVTVGPTGTRTTVGLPGTGMSYTTLARPQAAPDRPKRRRHPVAVALALAVLALIVAAVLAQ